MEERKENLKSGTEVGTISDVACDSFSALNAKRAEAWRELQLIREEERNIWVQIQSDLELSDEYVYSIGPVTGKVRVVRKLSKSGVDRERQIKRELKEEEGGEE